MTTSHLARPNYWQPVTPQSGVHRKHYAGLCSILPAVLPSPSSNISAPVSNTSCQRYTMTKLMFCLTAHRKGQAAELLRAAIPESGLTLRQVSCWWKYFQWGASNSIIVVDTSPCSSNIRLTLANRGTCHSDSARTESTVTVTVLSVRVAWNGVAACKGRVQATSTNTSSSTRPTMKSHAAM